MISRTRVCLLAVPLGSVLAFPGRPAAIIGGQNLRRLEMLPRKRALARSGHADQHDERKFWNGKFHLSNRETFAP